MKLKNISLTLGLAGLGLILGSPKVQALDWNFNHSYTDSNSQIWNGQGTLSYNGSGNNQTFVLSNLSFTETSGITTKTYSLDNLFQPFVSINSTGDIDYFQLAANNPSYSSFDYGRYMNGSPGTGSVNVVSYNNSIQPDQSFVGSISFSPRAVPWNIEPGQGIALGLPLFIGLRMLKKRMANNSKSEVQEMVRSR